MLLTKKVTALTGDVRSLFEVLRSSIDLSVAQVKKPSEDNNPLNVPPMTVTPQHVLTALKDSSVHRTHSFYRCPIHISKAIVKSS